MEQGIKKRSYQIKELWSKHKKMIFYWVSGLYNQKEIASMLGVSEQTVNNIINSKLGKQVIEMLEGASDQEAVDMLTNYKILAPIALAVQQGFMLDEGTPKTLRSKIADKIQDRAGYTPFTKNLNLNLNQGLTREDIQDIQDRAAKIRESRQIEVEEDGR